jgi:hypothetical protein
MIIVKLIGGLGNQLFQYAAGRYLSHVHQTDLLLDTSFLNINPDGAYTKRNLELGVFNIDLKIATEADIKKFRIKQSNKISREFQRTLPILYTNLYAAESGVLYQKQFLNFPKNTYLDGFWQCEKYFKSIESVLVNELKPRIPLNEANKYWLTKIQSCESVSIHVRRGDYVSDKTAQSHHGVCSLDYYSQAVELIQKTHKLIEVFVFSDDLDWCKQNLKFTNTHFVDANQTENFHLDMVLMSHCKHNIIANSSFSWWGAWLNRNKQKIVIAPKQWFSNQSINIQDLIPEQWIKM